MFAMKSVDDLWNHIAYVLAYAPDDFPQEDFLSAEDQITLDKAFERLHAGVLVAYPEAEWRERRGDLHKLLDSSYLAYPAGNDLGGAALLNDFEDRVFHRAT